MTKRRGRPPEPDKPVNPQRARVVELFDQGHTINEIAAAVGTTRQNVWTHLKNAGRNYSRESRARRRAAGEADRARFAEVWNAAPDRAAAAERLNLSLSYVSSHATMLREKYGLPLKRFRQPVKAHKVEELLRQGLRPPQIIADGVASAWLVYQVTKRLRAEAK